MRIPIIAGNWKMNTNMAEATELVTAMKKKLNRIKGGQSTFSTPVILFNFF
ncbi:MAG: triose-phosphate isomerase, partial [Chloroflexota bacterium]|nr:triose-phosphate isomerase [Chloroflexota bacterium]